MHTCIHYSMLKLSCQYPKAVFGEKKQKIYFMQHKINVYAQVAYLNKFSKVRGVLLPVSKVRVKYNTQNNPPVMVSGKRSIGSQEIFR